MIRALGFAALLGSIIFGTTVLTAKADVAAPKSVSSPTQIRVAAIGLGFDGCTATPVDGSAKAYLAHLKTRLGNEVSLCNFKDTSAAAQALIAKEAEIAIIDPNAYATIKDKARAILAPRYEILVGRVLAVALTTKASGRTSLAQLVNARPIFISSMPASHAAPLKGLSDYGVVASRFGGEIMTPNEDAGLAALREGRGDVLILTAGARQRLCRGDDPKEILCADVVEVWRGRPTANQAFVVRNDMVDADRYQLIGIHIAMHNENKAAFAFIENKMPNAIMLDPTEAAALVKGPR